MAVLKKFEYKIFNLSEADEWNSKRENINKRRSWLDFLNMYGLEGWEYTGTRMTNTSFLLKREVT